MNVCITNSSEVLSHGLCSFSHCYAERTHFIVSCLSYVASVIDLRKKNTFMRIILGMNQTSILKVKPACEPSGP